MADYSIPDIYQGGYSSLNPTYGSVFTGYRVKDTSTIGVSSDPRTANVLKDVSDKLASGQKVIELSLIDLGTPLDTITKQQLTEVRRLAKLTNVDVTVHGPIADASGISQQGRNFDENQRQIIERKLINSIERAQELNENGNIPVTFHTSNALPGKTWGISKDGKRELMVMPVVNQETGEIAAISLKEKNFPGEGKRDIQQELKKINEDVWRQNLSNLAINVNRTEGVFEDQAVLGVMAKAEKESGRELNEKEKRAMNALNAGTAFLNESYRELRGLYEMAYKGGDENSKKALKDLNEKIGSKVEEINKNPNSMKSLLLRKEIVDDGLQTLNNISLPTIYKPAEEYALEKTAQTYGNVAFESWNKFGGSKKAPIINIENPPAGGGLSTGEDLRDVIVKSQEKFAERLVKEKNYSETEAKKEAEKMIGATWDVGHINQLRRYGFTGKDILKQVEAAAPHIRHIHLSDNFGMDNIELPMGMGNVDFKETMNILGEKGEKAKKIVEAAHWWQHMQSSPFAVSLEGMGAPIYSMGGMPYWNQTVGLQQGYLGGYGMMLPQINYETFGAGFSNLPMELGGQRQQTGRGRMSGTPME